MPPTPAPGLPAAFTPAEVVLHIPHAATHIPSFEGYVAGRAEIQQEIDLLTDWHTDALFRLAGAATVRCAFSRVFCDVERLPDAQEPMFARGRGFFYTHRDNGTLLRTRLPGLPERVWQHYYQPHHAALTAAVAQALAGPGRCLLLDCHSFADTPFQTDLNQATPRPDICLGTDDFHTPAWLLAAFRAAFEAAGFSVAVDAPYAGTLVPTAYYRQDARVLALMVELNRRLYLRDDYTLDPAAQARIGAVLRSLVAA